MKSAEQRTQVPPPAGSAADVMQKIFVYVVAVAYVLQVGLELYQARGRSRILLERLFIDLVPIGFMAVAYVMKSRPLPRSSNIFQSLIVAITTYMVWAVVISLAGQLFPVAIRSDFRVYVVTAAGTLLVLAAVLFCLRRAKIW